MASSSEQDKDPMMDRLNALQMADLGTARRERISTADDSEHHPHIELEEIERRRRVNIPGTFEYQQAASRRDILSKWLNFSLKEENRGRTEQLADIMHGQSHRARLMETLYGMGPAQQPVRGRARSSSHPTNHPIPTTSRGRGGGVIGPRGRSRGSPNVPTHARVHSQGSNMPTRKDPALNINNPDDPASNPFRGRGRGRGGYHNRGQGSNVPTRQDPALNINNPDDPASNPFQGRGGFHNRGRGRGHGRGDRGSPAAPGPSRPRLSGDYAKRLTDPDVFMAKAQECFARSPTASQAPSSPTSQGSITPKAVIAPKGTTAPKAVPRSSLDDSIHAIPQAPSSPTPRGSTTPKAVIAPKGTTAPKAVPRSSLDNSIHATPATPPSATRVAPRFPSQPPRIVPLEKTAAFSRAQSARPKAIDEAKSTSELQETKLVEASNPILLDIDSDDQQTVENQVRDILFSPSMADLNGLTFSMDESDKPAGSMSLNEEFQKYIAKEVVRVLGGCRGYIEDYAGKQVQSGSSQPKKPLSSILATLKAMNEKDIQAISQNIVENWVNADQAALSLEEHASSSSIAMPASPISEQARQQVQPLTMADQEYPTVGPTRNKSPKAAPDTPQPGSQQVSDISLAQTVVTDSVREPDESAEASSFDEYRTPPESVSGTVTDSSGDQYKRLLDASLLSPTNNEVNPDLPTREFESLRVSERDDAQAAARRPLPRMDTDLDLTPTKKPTGKALSRASVLGSMESSKFAGPVEDAHRLNKSKVIGIRPSCPLDRLRSIETTLGLPTAHGQCPSKEIILRVTADDSKASTALKENKPSGFSNVPQDAPVPAEIVQSAMATRATAQDVPTQEAFPAAERKYLQEPSGQKSEVAPRGISESKWAFAQSQLNKSNKLKPAAASTSTRQPSVPSARPGTTSETDTETRTAPKVQFLGPAPYNPRQK